MSAPTPMPWHADGLSIESARHGNIGIVNLARASKADARLIAAAPEMLEALQSLVSDIDDAGGAAKTGLASRIVDDARSAIAKATGAE